ncbi:Site-specific recombinase XerD [Thioclava dalianensis]|uniref:integrase n=1 Tax=Thioclava dalianensis TaxID=1185766 RepID=UPI0008F62975|nr:Site-specific recombinase XerD [Thioclava dalianensis]
MKTDSEAIARQKAATVWQSKIEAWEAKLAGDSADAEKRFEAAKRLASARGFRFLEAPQVADLPLAEIVDRVEAAPETAGQFDQEEARAVLGGAAAPAITVTRALDLFWELERDRVLGKSRDQKRRWENPRRKAVANFIAVIGDKPMQEITRDDMLEFRDWWMARLETEGLTANSANKDLTHLGDILKSVNAKKKLKLDLPLSDLKFKQGKAGERPPFSDSWIRERLLAEGALNGLNDEARAIFLGMVNTGMRPSELAALHPEEIVLSADIPHLNLQPLGRALKSNNAQRIIPLLGVSLEAMKEFPDGFPRYRGGSASLSATVNKFLRENDLLETPRHTLYSLLHNFEDRMLEAGIDERIRRDIMGHALGRQRYGEGGRLLTIARLLSPIAF